MPLPIFSLQMNIADRNAVFHNSSFHQKLSESIGRRWAHLWFWCQTERHEGHYRGSEKGQREAKICQTDREFCGELWAFLVPTSIWRDFRSPLWLHHQWLMFTQNCKQGCIDDDKQPLTHLTLSLCPHAIVQLMPGQIRHHSQMMNTQFQPGTPLYQDCSKGFEVCDFLSPRGERDSRDCHGDVGLFPIRLGYTYIMEIEHLEE